MCCCLNQVVQAYACITFVCRKILHIKDIKKSRKEEKIMNYGKIIYCDTANGIGCRTVLFVSGCRHHCNGCFNEIAWKFDYGRKKCLKKTSGYIQVLRGKN